MKYFAAFFVFCVGIVICLVGLFHLSHTSSVRKSITKAKVVVTPTPVPVGPATTTLFVPYWTLTEKVLPSTYTQIAYFGIDANSTGIDTEEDGYKGLAQFTRIVPPQVKTLLVVRLITPDVDDQVLTDVAFQKKIITQSISVAKQYGFSGIVLDFEYSALAFDSVIKSISKLSSNFSTQAHAQQLEYYQTLYGDTFYRLRPFDVQAIGKVSDGIFIMAYDFHKANGNPGPNFPLRALDDEDYSFIQMVQDFTSKVPLQKITVLFGLFGYDWTMNNKDQSLGQAEVLTTLEAQKEFLSSCQMKDCKIVRDKAATEQHVQYVGSDDRTHDVWFEDMGSVVKKQAYLKSKGISSTGFWAWSYF